MKQIKEDTQQKAISSDDKIRIECHGSKTLDDIKAIATPEVLAGVGISIAMQSAVILAAKKIKPTFLAKIAFRLEQKGLMMTAKIVKNIGAKLGIKALQRFGIKAGETAAIKAAAGFGAKLSVKASNPLLLAATLAFDVLSLALDLGDAGGYNKMATKGAYMTIKKEIDQQMLQAFQDNGGTWPSIVGPLDKMSADDLNIAVTKQSEFILDPTNNDPLIKPMIDKLAEDLKNKVLDISDLDDETIVQKYTDLLDMDAIYNKAFNNVCINNKGKVVGESQCSYPDKQSCDSSYQWPPGDDDIYAEYKPDVLGGSCVVASYAVRSMCEDNDIPYDSEKGICKIDETYCKTKENTKMKI
jgi:hypothetical protein